MIDTVGDGQFGNGTLDSAGSVRLGPRDQRFGTDSGEEEMTDEQLPGRLVSDHQMPGTTRDIQI